MTGHLRTLHDIFTPFEAFESITKPYNQTRWLKKNDIIILEKKILNYQILGFYRLIHKRSPG